MSHIEKESCSNSPSWATLRCNINMARIWPACSRQIAKSGGFGLPWPCTVPMAPQGERREGHPRGPKGDLASQAER